MSRQSRDPDEVHDPLSAYLQGLPDARPNGDLGARVVSTHLRRRRWKRIAPIAVAAGVAALMLLPHSWGPSLDPPQTGNLQMLAEVRDLDRTLQRAYLRDASDGELEILWDQRALMQKHLGEPASASKPRIRL
jgi:hypothetical protein